MKLKESRNVARQVVLLSPNYYRLKLSNRMRGALIRNKLFISYSHYDSEWLRRLHVHLRPLERDGQVERWDDTRIGVGEQWHEEIQTALAEAKVAVLLISADFLASDFIASEELPKLLDAAVNDGLVILPVLVKPCRLKQSGILSRIQAVNPSLRPLSEMTESEQEALWVTLIDAIEKTLIGSGPFTPEVSVKNPLQSSGGPICNIPYSRNAFFTGRDDRLSALRSSLQAQGIAALCGLGGIGKTQTAIEYAFRHQNEYRAIFWTGSETEQALTSGFTEIAKVLRLPEAKESDLRQAVASAKQWLQNNTNWLLIFDNADTPSLLRSFRPSSNSGHILVTSRTQVLHSLGISSALELDRMTLAEATRFIQLRTGRDLTEMSESMAASEIANELGCLPLALEQAAAYITANHCRLQDYLRGYRKRRLGVLPPPVAGEYPESVATTWAINFAEVETSLAAADLLRLSAFLASDNIPLELINKATGMLGPTLAVALKGVDEDPLLLDEALEPLTRYSLIHREVSTNTYSIHRIVQAVIKSKMDSATLRLWEERSINALCEGFPSSDFCNWPACERLITHARVCVGLIIDKNVCTETSHTLLYGVAAYLLERAQYDEAEPYLLHLLEWQKRHLGTEHVDTARTIDCLASLYYDRGLFAKSEPFYEEALNLRQQLLPDSHPERAASLYACGRLCYRLGKYEEAENLLIESLKMRERHFGRNHPQVAGSLYGLARLHYRQAWYGTSKDMFNESLRIRENTLGVEHPDCAMSLTGLGLLQYIQGNCADAEALFRKSLILRTNALGPDHPDIAGSLSGLALTLAAQHRFDEMQPVVERALQIREKALGKSHLYTATPLYAFGALLHARGSFNEAEDIYKRVRSIREGALGARHPSVAMCLKDLAQLNREQRHFEVAEQLFARALLIEQQQLRENHPRVLQTLTAYAQLYREWDRHQDAQALDVQAANSRSVMTFCKVAK